LVIGHSAKTVLRNPSSPAFINKVARDCGGVL
jgi:hypothetical protein